MASKRAASPKRLYLEQWPIETWRDDHVHYEQVGYGDDMMGNTSRITVYRRMTRAELATERRVTTKRRNRAGGSKDGE